MLEIMITDVPEKVDITLFSLVKLCVHNSYFLHIFNNNNKSLFVLIQAIIQPV